MGVSLSRVEPISGFFEAGRLTVAELGQRLVDLGDVACRCSNDDFRRESITHDGYFNWFSVMGRY